MLSTIDFAVITYDANWVISLIIAVLIIALGDFIIFKYVSRHPAFIPGLIAFEAAALLAFIRQRRLQERLLQEEESRA